MLSKTTRTFFLAATLAATVIQANATNLVVDPGFESGTANTYTGNMGDGWIVTAGTGAICNISGAGCGSAGLAHSGSQMAQLDWNNNQLNTITQSLTTVAGQSYTISYFIESNQPNFLEVTFGGSTLFNGTSPITSVGSATNYMQYTFTSTATSISTVLAFSGDRIVGGGEILLDDVSVTPTTVPEPPSLLLLGTSLLGLFGRFAAKCRPACDK